jgi:hypothetical protein
MESGFTKPASYNFSYLQNSLNKNKMKAPLYLIVSILLFSCNNANYQTTTKGNWQSLFDGKTLTGWRNMKQDIPPEKSWVVENGALVFDPAIGSGSDIITTRTYKDFEFTAEFKISEGGNSGIKYFLLPNTNLGCEFQIIDDSKHPDALLGENGNRKTAALYDIMPPNPSKPYKPAGEWNTIRIITTRNHVEHWLNDAKVLEYEKGSEAFKEAIAKSKFNKTAGFAETTPSPILLQAHGDKVSFRNIKIRE